MIPTPAEQTLESAWARRWVEWWERYDDLVAERNRLVAIGADPDSLLVPDAPPAEPTLDDALDYDPEDQQLILTNRLGPGEYGAASVVATDVTPWFGLWAVGAWLTPPPAEPTLDVERLARVFHRDGACYHGPLSDRGQCYDDAENIANDYARLTEDKP